MVDFWSSNVSFTSYYNLCTPMSCTFEYISRTDFFSLVTTIISIFGGLSLGFKLIILIILRLTEKLIDDVSCVGLMHFLRLLFTCHDEHQMRRRLHFVLVVVSLFVLYLFSAFKSQSITMEVKKPSLVDYQDLVRRFSDSVQCPCSHISIEYQSFLNITPRFHKVCSSVFVSDQWIEYLYGTGNLVLRFNYTNFRYSATAQFQSLASLCQLSQQTLSESLSQLVKSNFISSQLLSTTLFDERIRATIRQFQETTPTLFLNIFSLIREMTAANMLMTILSTNWVIATPLNTPEQQIAHTIPLVYDGCSCSVSSTCVQSSQGMLVGCYPLETLMQMTLECLYDQTCIDPDTTFKAMNFSYSNPSHFQINSTIESLVNKLMIEEYLSNMSYEKYFAQCASLSCRYSYVDKSNLIEGMTTLISLYGGLVIICGTIATIIIKLFRCRTAQINPQTD